MSVQTPNPKKKKLLSPHRVRDNDGFYVSTISSHTNPVDILRLKHFRLLRNLEKYELNPALHKRQNTEFLFKENDLLHENVLQETQKQKRRKKK
jgi:hypothetical protein